MGTVLLAVLTLSPTPAYAKGALAPAVADSSDPPDSPSSPPDDSPTPAPSGSAPSPPASPTPRQPAPSPTTRRSGPHGQRTVLTLMAYASNAVLDSAYWRGARATSFTVTVRNTGTVAAAVRIDYTVPDGVGDAATGACGHGHCAVPSVAPGGSVALPVAVTVSPDAWRRAPLTGRFTVTAGAAGGRTANGEGTWGVVFPPGPPAPGIDLHVDDVTLGDRPGVPGQLRIRLTNTGALSAAARLDLVVPQGFSAGPMPAGCAGQPTPDPAAPRCVLGTLPPGGQRSVVVPLIAGAATRVAAPLTGLVRATLTAAGQQARTAQASYQILAPASLSGVSARVTASAAVPPAPSRRGRPVLDPHSILAWPVIVGSSAVLVLVLVGLALGLRRRSEAAAEPAGADALDAAPARPDRWWYCPPRLGAGTGPAPVPLPSGPVRIEWLELPGPAALPERPVAENPPRVADGPPEMAAELAEVAADLAEVAAILAGSGADRKDRPV